MTPICPVFGLASRICQDLTNCCVVPNWTRAVLWVLTIHTGRRWSLHLQRLHKRNSSCQFVTGEACAKWKCEHVAVDKRWVELFTHFHQQDIPCANVFKMVEFCLSLPGTNADTERVFSLMNDFRTSEKTQMSTDTVKNILIYYSNKFWCFLSRLPHIAGNASAVAQSILARSTSLNRLYKSKAYNALNAVKSVTCCKCCKSNWTLIEIHYIFFALHARTHSAMFI